MARTDYRSAKLVHLNWLPEVKSMITLVANQPKERWRAKNHVSSRFVDFYHSEEMVELILTLRLAGHLFGRQVVSIGARLRRQLISHRVRKA